MEIKTIILSPDFLKIPLILAAMGIIAGIVDVLPMIKQKIDKYSCCSAFLFHLIMPIILYYLYIFPNVSKALLGGPVYLICALPIVALTAKFDKKSVPIILISSFIIGTICGFIMNYL